MRWIATCVLLLCLLPFAYADDPNHGPPSLAQMIAGPTVLKSLSPVYVLVVVDKALTDSGVDKSALESHIELRLREAGVPISDTISASVTIGGKSYNEWCPDLIVDVSGLKVSDTEILEYEEDISLYDYVMLIRPASTEVACKIWDDSNIGYCGTARLDSITEAVDKQLDNFCNDYLKANPKSSSGSVPATEGAAK